MGHNLFISLINIAIQGEGIIHQPFTDLKLTIHSKNPDSPQPFYPELSFSRSVQLHFLFSLIISPNLYIFSHAILFSI